MILFRVSMLVEIDRCIYFNLVSLNLAELLNAEMDGVKTTSTTSNAKLRLPPPTPSISFRNGRALLLGKLGENCVMAWSLVSLWWQLQTIELYFCSLRIRSGQFIYKRIPVRSQNQYAVNHTHRRQRRILANGNISSYKFHHHALLWHHRLSILHPRLCKRHPAPCHS